MKQLILSTLALLLAISVMGQKEGTIQYVRVTQLSFEAPEGMEAMFKNMPKEQSTDKVLLFSGKQSIYQNPDDKVGKDNMVTVGDDDMQMSFDFQEPDEKYFIDLDIKESVHQTEFMGKQFLIKGTPKKVDWKLGKGKKKIVDYICMEATTMIEDTITVTAWFTPQIPVSIGPNGFGGLPGMILQIERDNGEQITTATSIELSTPKMELIMAPTKGKKVKKEQFDKIVKEKMAEMEAQHSGGGVFIDIRH